MAAKKGAPPQGPAKSGVPQPNDDPDLGGPETIDEVFTQALPRLEEALKKLPQDKVVQARKEADEMLSGDVSWADLTKYTPEKLYHVAELGFNQFRVGQYDSAERLFKGLTVIDPDNYYYHQMLGAVFQRKEKLPEAVVEYSVAADLNPKDMVSLTNRGEVYMKLGVLEMANADFDAAVALDPKGEDKWANRSRVLREQIRLMKQRKK